MADVEVLYRGLLGVVKGGAEMTDSTKKRSRGRPVEKPMPAPIPDTPESVARALLSTPPKGESDWDYLKARKLEAVAASMGKPPKSK